MASDDQPSDAPPSDRMNAAQKQRVVIGVWQSNCNAAVGHYVNYIMGGDSIDIDNGDRSADECKRLSDAMGNALKASSPNCADAILDTDNYMDAMRYGALAAHSLFEGGGGPQFDDAKMRIEGAEDHWKQEFSEECSS